MTVTEAIRRADELRPNALADQRKAAWVCDLEGRLAQMMGMQPPIPVWPEDMQLAMAAPYDNVYELYLCAMIDLGNQETALYANDMAAFNAAYSAAAAWWRRENCPERGGDWRVM